MTDLDGVKLAPCPFCGGVGFLENMGPFARGVTCDRCETSTRYYDTDEEATAAWNHRSPTPEAPAPAPAPAPALGSGETEWIGDFLNRRTDVEKVLRDVKRGKRQALSPEECWELADRLSVPANHGGA